MKSTIARYRLLILAVLTAAMLVPQYGTAMQIFQPDPGNPATSFYVRNALPTAAPPFVHWDLRQYDNCRIPWSISFPGGAFPPLDVNLDGANNNAADQAAVQGALANALAAWQAVMPAIIELQMLGTVPGGQTGLARDNFNVFTFTGTNGALAQDDQDCGLALGALAPAPGGVAANRPFAPVVAPGPDFQLVTGPQQDDMVVPCIIDGGDGNGDTTAAGDDVQIVAAAGAVPGNCNVVITAGPNGALNTPVNNAPAGGADDRVSACIVAGPNGQKNTPANNRGTPDTGAITALFFNNQSGVILEADIEFGPRFWSVNGNGAVQLQGIRAGADGDVDSAAAGDDVQNFAVGTGGLDPNTIVIGPGANRVINTAVAAGDVGIIPTTDLQMIATHEIGHTIGIAHPVDGRESNDVQTVAVGGAVAAGGVVVGPGPAVPPFPARLDTQPQGDDMVMGNNIVDGGDGTANTTANNAQTMNDAGAAGANNNIMNPFFSTTNPTNHTLSIDDEMACNWLYTPDLGDAPDPWAGVFNAYQSLVHTTAQIDTLNGQGVFQPGEGPVHLFGFRGPNAPHPGRKYPTLRFEWLGADMDDDSAECESRQVDADMFDDGVVAPALLVRGAFNRITVSISHTAQAGRYAAGNPNQLLYLNGYLDFENNCVFDPANLELWWEGVPGVTVAASANLVATVFGANSITLTFKVFVPVGAADEFYCRYRLDYGEDEGLVQDISGDNDPAEGAAQFGEVEDYYCQAVDKAHCGPGAHWIETCAAGSDTINFSEGRVGIDFDLDCVPETILSMFGPVIVDRSDPLDDSINFPGLAPVDGHLEVIDTEIVSMNLIGGGATLVAGAGLGQGAVLGPSLGAIVEVPDDPASANSFFRVLFEVDVGGGMFYYNQTLHGMDSVIEKVPPKEDIYLSPLCIPLFNSPSGGVHVANMTPACHGVGPPCEPRCGDYLVNQQVEECDGPDDAACQGSDVCCNCTCSASPCCPPVEAPAPDPSGIDKNRFISFVPGNPGVNAAIRVTMTSVPYFPACTGGVRWVDAPATHPECAGPAGTFDAARLVAAPVCMDWSAIALLNVYGPEIAPDSDYVAEMIECTCDFADPASYSPGLAISTGEWGDIVAAFGGAGQPNFLDIAAIVDKFQCLAVAVSKSRTKLQPNLVDPAPAVNFLDISACVGAFAGAAYPFPGPGVCP